MKEWKIATVIAVVIVAVILLLVLLLPRLQAAQKVTQVQIRVEYSGVWAGSYSDNSGTKTWYGIGNTTITLNRGNIAGTWQVSAQVGKNDFAAGILQLNMIDSNGQVIEDSTIGYNVITGSASISHSFP